MVDDMNQFVLMMMMMIKSGNWYRFIIGRKDQKEKKKKKLSKINFMCFAFYPPVKGSVEFWCLGFFG